MKQIHQVDQTHYGNTHDASAHEIRDPMAHHDSSPKKDHESGEDQCHGSSQQQHKGYEETTSLNSLGMICLYKVTSSGGMKRMDEVPIKMARDFIPSQNGNMMLVRSYDKKLISLVHFDKER